MLAPICWCGCCWIRGLKKSECMALKPENIERDAPPMVVIRHRKPNNVYKERKIALDPSWLDVLDEYLEQYKPEEYSL